jgi:hypothetical protein
MKFGTAEIREVISVVPIHRPSHPCKHLVPAVVLCFILAVVDVVKQFSRKGCQLDVGQ